MTAPVRYPAAVRGLHWLVAGLVALQLGLALVNARLETSAPGITDVAVRAHVSVGALILLATVLRLGIRLVLPAPALPIAMGRGQRWLARASHAALYAVVIALPLTGWLKLAALGYPVRVLGVLPLPVLDFMPDVARRARAAHELLGLVLGVLLVAHVAAALLHERVTGVAVLPRMGLGGWPARSDR